MFPRQRGCLVMAVLMNPNSTNQFEANQLRRQYELLSWYLAQLEILMQERGILKPISLWNVFSFISLVIEQHHNAQKWELNFKFEI